MKQLARQPGWQDILTKLYVKESFRSHANSQSELSPGSSLDLPPSRPLLRRQDSIMVEERYTHIFQPYSSSQEDEEEDFKSIDSTEQGSHSSSLSNAMDIPIPRREEEGLYYPLSPFELDLGGIGQAGSGNGNHTPGSQSDTPSPLDSIRPFPGIRTRKSSSLSNVLSDTSYGTDPPPGDNISNTSNPQV